MVPLTQDCLRIQTMCTLHSLLCLEHQIHPQQLSPTESLAKHHAKHSNILKFKVHSFRPVCLPSLRTQHQHLANDPPSSAFGTSVSHCSFSRHRPTSFMASAVGTHPRSARPTANSQGCGCHALNARLNAPRKNCGSGPVLKAPANRKTPET